MRLELLDINNFIITNKLQPVTSTNMFSVNGISFDPNGLWSEEIFGRMGSKDRRSIFGYINLNTYIINPILYSLLFTITPDIKNVILSNKKYVFKKNNLIEDENGDTGLIFFYKILKDITFVDLIKNKKEKKELAQYLDTVNHLIMVDKILVLPAGDRDLSMTKAISKQIRSPVNNLYESTISLSSQILIQTDEEMKNIFTTYIQKNALQILTWLQDNIKGKQGLFRSTMLKKTVDYSARIAATSDPELPLGKIGIPWHSVLLLYQPFFFNHVMKNDSLLKKDISEYLNTENVGIKELTDFIRKIIIQPEKITGEFKDALVSCAEKITENKYILCKRDPVVSRESYYSAKIKVLSTGRVVTVNSLTVTPQKLDFDGDQLALLPLFTEEANKEAEKLDVTVSKSAWVKTSNFKGHNYILTLDTISTIYAATLE